MPRLQAHLFALLGISLVTYAGVESPRFGTVLFIAGLIGLASLAALMLRVGSRRRRPGSPAAAAAPSTTADRLATSKRVLIAMLALGIAAYVGGGSTFSSFNAETSNLGNTSGTGTLTMSDTVGASTCNSYGAVTLDNTNNESAGFDANACATALTLSNEEPGTDGGQQAITISNTGSLDASKFYVSAAYVNATLNAALTVGAKTSLTVTGLEGPIANNDSLTLSYGPNSQTCTASGTTAPGATTISIASCSITYAYPVGTRIVDTSSDTTASNTDCYDQKTTTAPVTGATYGGTSGLTFDNIPYTNGSGTAFPYPLCQSTLFYIQEASNQATATLTGTSAGSTSPYTINGSTTSLSFSGGLAGQIKSGDPVTVSDTTDNAQSTCTATAAAATNATSVAVSGCYPTFTTFTATHATVNDTYDYCWSGKYYSGDQSMCYAPVGSALTATSNSASAPYTINTSTTWLEFAAGINGNIRAGDSLTITDTANNSQSTCTVSGTTNYYTGSVVIPVTCTGSVTTFSASSTTSTVADTTSMTALNGDSTDTISNFDTTHSPGTLLELKPLSANGTPTATPLIELNRHAQGKTGAGDVRTFDVGVYVPAPTNTSQNYLQALQSTFGLKWHIDQ